MIPNRTGPFRDALARLAQAGGCAGSRLVRLLERQERNQYRTRPVEFADDGSTRFASEREGTVINLAEPADQPGRVPPGTDAVAVDIEGRWVVFVRPPAGAAFPARVVSSLGTGRYLVREQAAGAEGGFEDRPEADDVPAVNLAELSLGPGAAVDDDAIVLVAPVGDDAVPPNLRYMFDHPAYAKYLD